MGAVKNQLLPELTNEELEEVGCPYKVGDYRVMPWLNGYEAALQAMSVANAERFLDDMSAPVSA